METVSAKNLDELSAFAAKVAAGLKGGEVIGLVGDLGAGKTTFTQMLARELGVERPVKSPTFILMQVHEISPFAKGGAGRPGITQLCHVDAYRIESETELFGVGLTDYLNDPQAVTVVEWADRMPSLHHLPNFLEYTFRFGEGEERLIDLGH